MNAKASVNGRTIYADENAIGYGSPCRIFGIAIEARLVELDIVNNIFEINKSEVKREGG